jgi:hypothetical protein
MGMIGYVIAAGIGYYAGQPEGRRQLRILRRHAADLARSPEVRRLRERGWDLVGDGALATKNLAAKTRSKSNPADGRQVSTPPQLPGAGVVLHEGRWGAAQSCGGISGRGN